MNLFYLHPNPAESAKAHYAKHLTKMPLELSQVLSTAHRLLDNRTDVYKATHINHPVSLFARSSSDSYLFVYEHLSALFAEFRFRRGKVHGCEKLLDVLKNPPANIPRGEISPLFNCTPYKTLDTLEAYRLYYVKDKIDLMDFECRQQPEWWDDYFQA